MDKFLIDYYWDYSAVVSPLDAACNHQNFNSVITLDYDLRVCLERDKIVELS